MKPMNKDSEKIYDEQISPLMTKIIAVCKENNIPMFSSFQLTSAENDEQGALFCTTCLPFEGMDEKINEFSKVSKKHDDNFLAYAIAILTPGKE